MKLSIITVVYNSSKFIENTILNVLQLKKRNDNIEYIVIDGGSTDGTCKIIEKYLNNISKFISEPDKGIYDAMNKGVKIADGDWLIFMNSGDLFYNDDKNMDMSLFSEIKDIKEYDIVYGNTLTKNSGTIITINPQEINRNFFFFNTICHQSVFFNKKVFENLGFYNLDYNIIADKDLLYRVANSNGKFYHLNKVISIWDEDGFSKENISMFDKEDNLFKQINYQTIERFYLLFNRKCKNLATRVIGKNK